MGGKTITSGMNQSMKSTLKCYGYEKSCNLEFYDEQNRKKVAFIPVTHWTLAFSYFLQGKLNSAVNLHIPVTHFLNLVLALFLKKNK